MSTNPSNVTAYNALPAPSTTPPNDRDSEWALTAALLGDPTRIHDLTHLRPLHFYDVRFAATYAAMRSLSLDRKPVNILTVANELRAQGEMKEAGGMEMLDKLRRTTLRCDLKACELSILERWQRREGQRIGQILQDESGTVEMPTSETFAYVATQLDAVANYVSAATAPTTLDQVEQFIDFAAKQAAMGDDASFPLFGIEAVDDLADVLGGSLVVVSGSTGSGKSSAYNTILNARVNASEGAYSWSGENPPRVQINRLMASRTGIDARDLKKGRYLEHEDLVAKVAEATYVIADSGIVIEGGGLTAAQAISKIHYLKATQAMRVFLFDRLELINVSELSRDVETGRAMLMQSLRVLAGELDVIIVMACQLRKSYESRPNHEPEIADLRGTSEIGDSSTHVVMLTRPEYHGHSEMEISPGNTVDSAGMGKMMVLKNTEGEIGNVICRFNKTLTLWESYDPDAFEVSPFPKQPYGGAVMPKIEYNDGDPF
ncbi:Replicative DNA helicase [Neolewinella maritima]|uniref:DNA 5'-3' helicase n=1 Tax=Neolewinella maritima TaxID=1383882 RepID=A0ABN8F6S4_9BACT|nr:DnaB-like helicase C-terminal domain-containing protein [Neolewinella maritima]CAH1002630.1 Replicative DNA helicase [Neolewinella maritima]